MTDTAAEGAILELLEDRAPTATICPSEAARCLAQDADSWRDQMPRIHAAVQDLVSDGRVRLSWKGIEKDTATGPYRIGRPA